MLIITTSNSPPPVAVDAVILARAWFSERLTNLRSMPGFSASKAGASLMASCICEFDTIAMVTVRSPEPPSAPAPAHPDTRRQSAAAAAPHTRLPVFTDYLPSHLRVSRALGQRNS
ncbi:hypothetical protein G9444_3838 [Rhodococcus erythropolis]|uniref:Uncharacterized protein n=1 Tax=Rhodococcus erythropolis TaxID=1833 RepID=A0A6G9CW48_RHOER|nr:hypothetical protein G9444_3838 [Rhodococcus erythropolis]